MYISFVHFVLHLALSSALAPENVFFLHVHTPTDHLIRTIVIPHSQALVEQYSELVEAIVTLKQEIQAGEEKKAALSEEMGSLAKEKRNALKDLEKVQRHLAWPHTDTHTNTHTDTHNTTCTPI